MNDFTLLYKTEDPFVANLIKSSLDAAEIFCVVNTNDASGTMPHLRPLQGGIDIFVHKDDLEVSQEVIQDFI